MSESIGRTTRLQAVNLILRNIGERQVTSLVDSTRGDVAASVSELDQQSREVQDEGWEFNLETHTLTPALGGQLAIPPNALTVVVTDSAVSDLVVQRGDRLYNMTENTDIFTDPITVQITAQLAFEDLPEQARYYIAVRAARIVAQSRVGDPAVVQFSAGDEQYARYQVESRELEAGEYNALSAPGINRLTNPYFR
jgi:hypothetical protein